MNVALTVIAIPMGLIIGGFVTMLVDRVPDRTALSIRSRCPYCGHRLGWSEVVPVVSWLGHHGRCRYCEHPITPAYPAVEIVTAALFVVVTMRFGAAWVVIPPLILVTAVMALSVIDLYIYRLPDLITFPAIALSVVAMVVIAFVVDRPIALGRALLGAVAYFVLLLIAHLISPRGMGFGDVKLSLLLGLHIGWVSGSTYVGWTPVLRLVLISLFIGSVLGVTGGVIVAILRKSRAAVLADPEAVDGQPTRLLAQSIPFGPALAAGAVIAVLFSGTLLGV